MNPPDRPDLCFINTLYGGYWNYNLTDFRYMINPYFPPQEMLDTIAASVGVLSRSYPSTNRHISKLLADYLNLEADEVVVANGASELISAIGSLFISRLAIAVPTFDEYVNRLRLQGKPTSLYETKREEDFELDLDSYGQFARESGSNAALFVRPNNPTGNLIPRAEMERALRELAGFDMVLVDESFIEFSTAEGGASILESVRDYDNLIMVKSLSKVYGIPGLRLGCAICANSRRADTLRNALPIWNVNSFAQRFVELLASYREEFRESCRKTAGATAGLYTELARLECLRPYATAANFVLCELAGNARSTELVAFLFDRYRLLIYDCSAKTGLDSRFVRISSRTEEENAELIAAIRAWEAAKR
jgi:threonine-phosphate decarboxylase